jgi:CRISPR/Cas system CSM-associated protein Csm4 (group 5 of RAMP superfamily)
MGKFETILTATGDAVLQKRAKNLSQATLETFEDEKRDIEKRIRNLENEIISMEDLSVRSTQELVVGEKLDTNAWVKKRVNIALELRDLKIEKEIVEGLITEYFGEEA